MTSDGESHITRVADCSVTWRVEAGTVRVDTLRTRAGERNLRGIELGKAFGRMPRSLWERTLFDFESQRDLARGGGAQ